MQKVWNLATVQIVLQDNFVLQCEVAGYGRIVLQPKVQIILQDGCRRPKCVAIQNCIVTRGAGAGRAGTARGAQATGARAAGARAAGARGTHGRARGERGRGAARRGAQALGARHKRAEGTGWPGLCTRCT